MRLTTATLLLIGCLLVALIAFMLVALSRNGIPATPTPTAATKRPIVN